MPAPQLRCAFAGLDLPHPFVAGASPLMKRVESVQALEAAGAAAVVLPSLFAEAVAHPGQGASEPAAWITNPAAYIAHLERLKDHVGLSVWASLNATVLGQWVELAQQLEEAGADALEVNLYALPSRGGDDASAIEERHLTIVREVRRFTSLPLIVKLSPFYTALTPFVEGLSQVGANAVVLFNHFYQPDIDTENLRFVDNLTLSQSSDLLLRLRWLATLSDHAPCDLAISGGIHTARDAIKALLAGAQVLQLTSLLLKEGPQALTLLRDDLNTWMRTHGYEELAQLQGIMRFRPHEDADAIARASYIRLLQQWSTDAVPDSVR